MPGADVPIQQCVGPFHSSVIPLLKLLMKIRDKHTTVQFKIGLLSPFGSFPPKFMNSGRACQLWTRRLWQNKFMNPIRNEQKRFHWFDGCASTNLCSLWSWWGREGGAFGGSLKRAHEKSICDALWIPSEWAWRYGKQQAASISITNICPPFQPLHWGHWLWSVTRSSALTFCLSRAWVNHFIALVSGWAQAL